MAQSKNSPKSTGSTRPKRRARRKPRPVTIDLEATEVTPDDVKNPDKSNNEPGNEPPIMTDEKVNSDSSQPADSKENVDDSTNTDPVGEQHISNLFSSKIALRAIPYGLAALVGGVFALLIYFWLAGLGWLPGTAGPKTARMNSEIILLRTNIEKISADLETLTGETIDGTTSRLSALESVSAKVGDVVALDNELSALQSLVTQISNAQSANSDGTNHLDARLNATETTMSTINELVEEIKDQVAKFSSAPDNTLVPATANALSKRISSLEKILEEAIASSDTTSPAGAVQVAALRSELEAIRDESLAVQRRLQSKITALETQTLSLQISSQESAATISNLNEAATERLQAMDNALSRLEIRREAGPVSQMERRAAMALSFATLGRAINSGKSFQVELEAAKAFAGDKPELESLTQHAETGIETVRSLADQFEDIASAIISAEKNTSDGDIFDRTWVVLQSIVRVRPTGFVEGETSSAIVARAESHLQSGQLADAIIELETLPELSLAAANEWINRAHARIDGEAAMAALNADLIANINAAPVASNSETNAPESNAKDANQ